MAVPETFFAPAKLNLALHVVGQRDDGYHLIETLAVFADVGDRIAVSASERDAFTIEGDEAGALANEDPAGNLVVKARDLLRRSMEAERLDAPPVHITLNKSLPAGAGIGGGSADAAATLRALMAQWGCPETVRDFVSREAVALGADVPMCLRPAPLIARGIGEQLTFLDRFPALHAVLVNPRVHVSTPAVFSALAQRENPPLPEPEAGADPEALCGWLEGHTRNDLQAPATSLHPVIRDCLEALRESGPMLARMSGSGSTCFGLYRTGKEASAAADSLRAAHPSWWIRPTRTTVPATIQDSP